MIVGLVAGVAWFWTARVMTPTANYLLSSWDLFLYFQPMYDYVGRALGAGRIPLWNPHQGCGEPLLGVLQGGVFHPARLLLLVLDTPRAMAWSAVGHIGVALVATFLYARSLRTSRSAAAVAGITFAFGVIAAMIYQPATFLEPGPWLPVAALAIHRVVATGRWRWVAAASFAIAAPILAGGYQIALYSVYGVAAVCLGLWLDPATRRAALTPRSLALVGACGVFALALSAPQWAPTLAWAPLTLRPAGTLDTARVDPFQAAPLVVLQGLLGRRAVLEGLFLPIPVAMLAVIGLRHAPRLLAPLVVLTLVSLALSLGAATPWFGLYYLLPGFAVFRAPMRLQYLVVFGAAVLAAFGVDGLRRYAAPRRRWADAAIATVLAAGMLGYAVLPSAKDPASAQTTLDRYDAGAAAATAAIGLLSPPLVGPAALGVATAAVWRDRTNAVVLPYSSGARAVARHAATYAALAERAGLYRTVSAAPAVSWVMPGFAAKNAMLFGFQALDDYEPLAQQALVHYLASLVYGAAGSANEMRTLSNVIVDQPFARPRLLDLASVRYVVTPSAKPIPFVATAPERYREVRELVAPMDWAKVTIVENLAALPRAYLVPTLRPAGGDAEALDAIADPAFDPTREVVAVGAPPLAAADAAGDDGATIVTYEPERVHITTTSAGARALVLTDAFAPGWSATVDGRPAAIWRANYLFRGVTLPPGPHDVTFTYAAPGYRAGLAAAGTAALLLVALPIADRRRRARRGSC